MGGRSGMVSIPVVKKIRRAVQSRPTSTAHLDIAADLSLSLRRMQSVETEWDLL
jgi:hypothetical protein